MQVRKYRQFPEFMEWLEGLCLTHRSSTLSIGDSAGHVAGVLALEAGRVAFGAQLQSRVYLDDIFIRQSPHYATIIKKLLTSTPISGSDQALLDNISPDTRLALCGLTGRALRKISTLCDPVQRTCRPAEPILLNLPRELFSPVELALSAGRHPLLKCDDAALSLYEAPPENWDERWLFQWQPDDPSCPWPIQTGRLGERSVGTVNAYAQLAHRLASVLRRDAGAGAGAGGGATAQVLRLGDQICYVLTTSRYLTLLVYGRPHLGRVLKAMEDTVGQVAPTAAPDVVALPASLPAPVQPARRRTTPLPMPRLVPPPPSAARPAPAPAAAERVLPPVAAAPASSTPVPVVVAAPPPAPAAVTPVPVAAAAMPPPPAAVTPVPVVVAATPPPPAAVTPVPVIPAAQGAEGVDAVTFSEPLLSLAEVGASVDGRTILKGLSFTLGRRGVYALMGPGGSGKSSLLGILSGRNRAGSGWTLTGELRYQGEILGTGERPAVVPQRVATPAQPLRAYLLADLEEGAAGDDERLRQLLDQARLGRLAGRLDGVLGTGELKLSLGEWRRLAIVRELLSDPRLLCVDEPTASLDDAAAVPVLDLVQQLGRERAVLLVTHNQAHARRASDYTLLLASGQLQEYRPTAAFFTRPHGQTARDYVRTGGCSVPSPDAQPEALEPPTPELPAEPPVTAPPVAAVVALPPPAAPARRLAGSPVWASPAPVLSLRDYGLRLGSREIVSGIDLDVAATGLYVLVAPDGGEKRLLVRSLSGAAGSSLPGAGQALYRGGPLAAGNAPATPQSGAQLVMMSVSEYLITNLPRGGGLSRFEQRSLALQLVESAGFPELARRMDEPMSNVEPHERRALEILRAAGPLPALLLLDEPLVGLGAAERARILRLLRLHAEQRAVLIFSRDEQPFAEAGAALAWLADGTIVAVRPLPTVVEAPPEPARSAAPPAEEPPAPAEPPPSSGPRGLGPRGFRWLRPGALAGMPAPGLTNDLGYDLELIRRTGVTWVVTLTAEAPAPTEALAQHRLGSIFFPIPDMNAPTEESAAHLCARVTELLLAGHAVGFHCKAGLGRTGTMLAALLIFEGSDAGDALAAVRQVEPGWVQSDAQVQFLSRFAAWLAQRHPRSAAPPPRVVNLR